MRASREQIVAFRASSLHLVRRLPAEAVGDAVRPVGLQDTPPGNAAVAAAARVEDLALEAWARALEQEKRLVELWAMRGSPFVVAVDDLPVFTLGLLPDDDQPLLHLITSGLAHVVEEEGVGARDLVERLCARASDVLDGATLTKRELGRALGPAVPEPLRGRLERSEELGWGDYDALSMLALTVARIVSHHGIFLVFPRAGNELVAVRTDRWLGREPPSLEHAEARAELARRFLHAFAPATAADLAWWATGYADRRARVAHEEQARRTWAAIEDELVAVERDDGGPAFVLARDAARLESPPQPDGVRLLPPHDPLLMLRDRDTLVADVFHRRVWRSQHSPGVVLAGVEVVATWRARKSGRRLAFALEPLAGAIDDATRDAIFAEADRVAAARGCESSELEVEAA